MGKRSSTAEKMLSADGQRVFEMAFGRKLSRVWLHTPVGDDSTLEKIHKNGGKRDDVGLMPKLAVSVVGKLAGHHGVDFVWVGPAAVKAQQRHLRAEVSYEALKSIGFEKWSFGCNGASIRIPFRDAASALLRQCIGEAILHELEFYQISFSGIWLTLGYGTEELLEASSVDELEIKMDLAGCKKTRKEERMVGEQC